MQMLLIGPNKDQSRVKAMPRDTSLIHLELLQDLQVKRIMFLTKMIPYIQAEEVKVSVEIVKF